MSLQTNRREFAKRAIATGVATSCGLTFNSRGTLFAQSGAAVTDEDILVFALNLIQSRDVLDAAAGIAITEGQHAGLLRFLMSNLNFNVTVPSVDPKAVPPLGPPAAPPTASSGRLFFVDGNGLTPARTTDGVLLAVYGGNPNGKAGFFPDGLNGKIERV